MVEPLVTLEKFKKTAPDYNFLWLPFAQQVDPQETLQTSGDVEVLSDSESESSSSSGDSASSEQTETKTQVPAKSQEILEIDEAVYAKVTHAMVISTDGNLSRPWHMEHHWKAACGAHMLHSETTFLDNWQDGMAFCQHAGCKKIWASINLT